MTEVVRFENVSRVFAGTGAARRVLNALDFSVCRGETVSITGRSGSGKSTLLHLAAGIDVPTKGEVFLGGEPLSAKSDRDRTLLRRDRVGLVFQFFHLLPRLSVAQNVALPEMIAGARPGSYRARVAALLDRVGLSDRSGDPAGVLSGGEMQRVAVCRALLRKPSILLADEPTGNLDDTSAASIMDLIFRLARDEGSTLVYVTHDAEMAEMADRTGHLHDGHLEF